MDRRIDTAVALAFAALGLFMIWNAGNIRIGLYRDPVGPRMFFYICGAMLAGGGLFLALQRVRHWRLSTNPMIASEGTADEDGYPASARRAFSLIGVNLAYVALLGPLGYLITTPIYIVASLHVLNQRNYAITATIGVVFTAFFYVIFAQVLNVRIGVGPLTDLFRTLGWINL